VDHPGVSREIGVITRSNHSLSPAALRFVEVMGNIL